MRSHLKSAVERALVSGDGALGMLVSTERPDAERLLQLVRDFFVEDVPPGEDEDVPPGEDVAARHATQKEVGRLVEILARRSAEAMPYAALGRALLAGMNGYERDAEALVREFEAKLALLGL